MNPLEGGYGTIPGGTFESEEERRQRRFRQCSKRSSVLMSLLACAVLAVGLFIWFQLIAQNDYEEMEGGRGDHDPFGRGNPLNDKLMSDNNIDYRMITNDDWRALWVNMGYDAQIANTIDFHTYSVLGVDYQKMYRDLKDEAAEAADVVIFDVDTGHSARAWAIFCGTFYIFNL